MKKLYSNKPVIFSLVLPGLLVFLFAVLAPICLSVYYGFTDYSGMGEARFTGFDNYVNLFHDSAFGRSLKNSLLLAIGFICIQHPLAILVAAVLDKLQGKAEGGGPNNSTQFAANYLYQQAFKAFKYGYGNAIGVVFIIICVLVTVALNTVFRDKQEA